MGHPFTSIASPASGWPNYGKRSQSGEIPDRRGDVSLSTHDPARLLVINIDGLAGFYWDDPARGCPRSGASRIVNINALRRRSPRPWPPAP